MFSYDLEQAAGRSLYEKLTACIRTDILSGNLAAGVKLPSKRRAAADLGISVVTVMGAYDQLLAEGYIVSAPRSGYFVADIDLIAAPLPSRPRHVRPVSAEKDTTIDLMQNAASPSLFPLSVWNRLSRRIFNEQGEEILRPVPYNGADSLKEAIADIVYTGRGIMTSPDDILISSGNQSLYSSLLLLLGRNQVFGVEDPGYPLIARLYRQHGAHVRCLPMDEWGVIPTSPQMADVTVLHISPSHHFPSGLVTPIARRQELLRWLEADENRYIIEDDYDSEFRLSGRPIPSLAQLDHTGRVIYINTFSKTIAPTLRVGYAILPHPLSQRYEEEFSYLACPVPSYEQYILSAFIKEGYFERHINRMRTHYRSLRDRLLASLEASPFAHRYSVTRADSGLHFLLHVDVSLSDTALQDAALANGIRVRCLSSYYDVTHTVPDTHTLVVGYAGLNEKNVSQLVTRLDRLLAHA